jgi:hypothetical protein
MNISFLVGMPRSGSTYFSKLLGTNPSVSISKKVCHIPSYIDSIKLGFLDGNSHRDNMIFPTPKQTQLAFETFVRGGITANCNPDSANIFKCREYMDHIELMHSIFDKPKFIYIVRNLADVVHSIREIIEQNPWKFNTKFANGDMINHIINASFLNKYLTEIQYDIDKINKYNDNFIVIKYEDLCSNTEATLLEISKFLDIESNFDFEKIDLTNYDMDSNYSFPISHDVNSKEIKYKKYNSAEFEFVEENLRKNFSNFYNQFNY